jgi:hypothetical protein
MQLLRLRQMVQGLQDGGGQSAPLPPVGTQLTTPQGDSYTQDDAGYGNFPEPAHAPLMQASHRSTLENLARAKAVSATMGHLRKLRPMSGPRAV